MGLLFFAEEWGNPNRTLTVYPESTRWVAGVTISNAAAVYLEAFRRHLRIDSGFIPVPER